MVKIQTRTIRKKYKSRLYSYKQHIIPIPLGKNDEVTPFLDKQLDLDLGVKEDTMNLKLKKRDPKGLKDGKK